MHVVRDDDLAVLGHSHVELQHLSPAHIDGAPEALQGILVGLGRPAAVGNVNIAAAPLLQCVDSEIMSKGCMNPSHDYMYAIHATQHSLNFFIEINQLNSLLGYLLLCNILGLNRRNSDVAMYAANVAAITIENDISQRGLIQSQS